MTKSNTATTTTARTLTPSDYREIRRLSRNAVNAALPAEGVWRWHADPANDGTGPSFYISEALDVSIEWRGASYGGRFVIEATEVEARGFTDRDLVDAFEIQLSHRAARLIEKAA